MRIIRAAKPRKIRASGEERLDPELGLVLGVVAVGDVELDVRDAGRVRFCVR